MRHYFGVNAWNIRYRLVLAMATALLALSLSGCDSLECQDGGRLGAAYQQGEAAAIAQNEADYDEGLSQGLALTYDDGETEGRVAGFDAGYASGFSDSGDYELGYGTGYSLGFDDGFSTPAACELGDEDGYAAGFGLGDGDGYALGYEAGYADNYQNCGILPDDSATQSKNDDEPSAEDIGICHGRGASSVRDTGSFARGRAAGIAQNEDYQEGYNRQYEIGFGEGESIGRDDAYDEGLTQGYNVGADEGWQTARYDCYDRAYPDGYAAGYDSGYQAGYADGSYEGDRGSDC